MTLIDYLDSKPLYYKEIDYERMPRVFESIKNYFNLGKVIHIIGTNGKGTTGRFLATALYNKGFSVGHYTSPHILKLNERIWLNGEDTKDKTLELAHEKLYTILGADKADTLSYFEYMTLLAMIVFEKCNYIVLEAGLGGEYDATAVFEKSLTLVTPIAYDHEAFLGSDIKSIANTKLNAIQNSAILAHQRFQDVYDKAKNLVEYKNMQIEKVEDVLTTEDNEKILKIAKELSLVSYLVDNLKLAIAALKFFSIEYKVDDFNNAKLFGRLTQLEKNIIVDVGHNPLAAASVAKALESQKVTLIYNSYKDKEYKKILTILKPIISNVEIIPLDDERVVDGSELQSALNELEIEYKTFKGIEEKKQYLVFGSFQVVEEFLKVYNG